MTGNKTTQEIRSNNSINDGSNYIDASGFRSSHSSVFQQLSFEQILQAFKDDTITQDDMKSSAAIQKLIDSKPANSTHLNDEMPYSPPGQLSSMSDCDDEIEIICSTSPRKPGGAGL